MTEEDLSRALLFCLERAKLVVEPAGAVAEQVERRLHRDRVRGDAHRGEDALERAVGGEGA